MGVSERARKLKEFLVHERGRERQRVIKQEKENQRKSDQVKKSTCVSKGERQRQRDREKEGAKQDNNVKMMTRLRYDNSCDGKNDKNVSTFLILIKYSQNSDEVFGCCKTAKTYHAQHFLPERRKLASQTNFKKIFLLFLFAFVAT